MRILVVSFNDSDNLTIENVLYELEKRGHQITIFAPFRDDNSIRMFKRLNAEIRPTTELTNKVAKNFDVAFCSVMMMQARLKFLDIYCFVYAPYIEEFFMTDGADFLFTYRKLSMSRYNFRCGSMPVGDPKNDKISNHKIDTQKRILFIDSGHMPFGTAGKIQIADMLLDICRKFPDYELCIKPRWLRGSNINYTHQNREHIYSIIEERCNGELPNNLNMLNEHLNLQELIDSSISVITLYTSALFNVILRDKGLLIASGWDNEDKWDVRNDIDIRDKEDCYYASGCLVDYREVTKYLPEGIHAKKEFSDKIFYYKTDASKRIVDVMEYIYNIYLSKGLFPTPKEYQYESFKDELIPDSSINLEALKYERIRDIFQQKIALFSYKITAPIDFSKYYQKLEETYQNCPLTESGFHEYAAQFNLLQNQILIDNASLMNTDAINQSFLLQAFYETGRVSAILEMPQENILCTGPYHFYLGQCYRKVQLVDAAIEHFCIYLNEANTRSYTKYIQEEDTTIRDVYNYVLKNYNGKNIDPIEFADIYSALYEKRNMTVASYKNRKYAHNFLPQVAEQLVDIDQERALKCFQLYAKWEYHYNIWERDAQIRTLFGSKSYRLSRAMKCFFKEVKGGIQCLQEHGWKYTIERFVDKVKKHCKKFYNKMYAKGPLSVWLHFRKDIMQSYLLYANIINKYDGDVQLYKTAAGTGDIYVACTYFDEYLKHNIPKFRPVLTVTSDTCREIAQLFGITDVEVIPHPKRQALTRMFIFAGKDCVRLTILNHYVKSLYVSILGAMETVHGMCSLDIIKETIYPGIIPNGTPHFFNDQQYIDSIFKKYGLRTGKTVVLAPYTASMNRFPTQFWEKLVDTLQKHGYSVITNSASDREPAIRGTYAVFVPISNLVPFVDRCGILIGARNGLMDVTATAKVKRVILYGTIRSDHGGRGGGGMNKLFLPHFSFNRWHERNDAIEIEFHPTEMLQIINDTVDFLDNGGAL